MGTGDMRGGGEQAGPPWEDSISQSQVFTWLNRAPCPNQYKWSVPQ